MNRSYTLTEEYCDQCGVPLAKELDKNKKKCKLCR